MQEASLSRADSGGACAVASNDIWTLLKRLRKALLCCHIRDFVLELEIIPSNSSVGFL